jgi:hypothetical protein
MSSIPRGLHPSRLFPLTRPGRMIHRRSRSIAMDRDLIIALAKAAGLDKALADYPDDVAAAAAQATDTAAAIRVPSDPATEPWPPMRAGNHR